MEVNNGAAGGTQQRIEPQFSLSPAQGKAQHCQKDQCQEQAVQQMRDPIPAPAQTKGPQQIVDDPACQTQQSGLGETKQLGRCVRTH